MKRTLFLLFFTFLSLWVFAQGNTVVPVQEDTAWEKGCRYEEAGQYSNAIECYLAGVKQKNIASMIRMADIYRDGIFTKEKPREAANLYFTASKRSGKCATDVGLCYLSGYGFPRDLTRGLLWLENAAAKGDKEAKACMAMFYQNGRAAGIDPTKAITVKKESKNSRMLLSVLDIDGSGKGSFSLAQTSAMLNLRTGPDVTYPALTKLATETWIILKEKMGDGEFVSVYFPDGKLHGYVSKNYLQNIVPLKVDNNGCIDISRIKKSTLTSATWVNSSRDRSISVKVGDTTKTLRPLESVTIDTMSPGTYTILVTTDNVYPFISRFSMVSGFESTWNFQIENAEIE